MRWIFVQNTKTIFKSVDYFVVVGLDAVNRNELWFSSTRIGSENEKKRHIDNDLCKTSFQWMSLWKHYGRTKIIIKILTKNKTKQNKIIKET